MTTAPVTQKSIFNRPERPYVNPYFGGMVLGIILFLALFLTGNGLGSSGGTTRLVAFIEDQINPVACTHQVDPRIRIACARHGIP